MTTLKVTVGEADTIKERTVDRIEAAERGIDLDDAQPVLNFENYADMARLLSEKNLELLDAIAEDEPESMRDAAALVDRDIKDVHRNLTELENLHLIEFEQHGRAKRPVVKYDTIEIEVMLRPDEDGRERDESLA
jgi:predicted transcriptional regulator